MDKGSLYLLKLFLSQKTNTTDEINYLVSAPVPQRWDGHSHYDSWPRKVGCDRVPEYVEGILPWQATAGVSMVVACDGLEVSVLQVLKASNFGKA